MVASCVSYKRNNLRNKNGNIQFHGILVTFTRPDILTRWINAIKRADWTPTKSSKLCSVHFLDTDYQVRPGASIKILKPDAVLSIFNFPAHMLKENTNRRVSKRCLDSNDNTDPPSLENSKYGYTVEVGDLKSAG